MANSVEAALDDVSEERRIAEGDTVVVEDERVVEEVLTKYLFCRARGSLVKVELLQGGQSALPVGRQDSGAGREVHSRRDDTEVQVPVLDKLGLDERGGGEVLPLAVAGVKETTHPGDVESLDDG